MLIQHPKCGILRCIRAWFYSHLREEYAGALVCGALRRLLAIALDRLGDQAENLLHSGETFGLMV